MEFPAIARLSEMTLQETAPGEGEARASLSEMTLQDTAPGEGEARGSKESADLAGSDVDTGSCIVELSDDELSADVSMPSAGSFQSAPGEVKAEPFQSAPGEVAVESAPGQVKAESFQSAQPLVGSEAKDFQAEIHLMYGSKSSSHKEEESAQVWTQNK